MTALPQGQLAQPGSATQPAAGLNTAAANAARAANARSDFNIGYCGYRFNGDIGAYTVRFRHYDPTPGMCRWLERDPAGYQDGPSLYSYLGRNPMAGTDPYGLWYSGSGITVIRPDQIRPPVAPEDLAVPPRWGLRLGFIANGDPALEFVEVQTAAASAIATTNAQRGVDNGLGFLDRLLLSDSPLHLTLQTIGLVPGLGEVADLADGLVYALEGDTANASVSFAAAIPFVGSAATTARWGKRAVNAADAVNDAVRRAADAVGPGRGAAHGTRVHSALESEIKALNRPDLRAELSFKDGVPVDRGTKGSIRLDVVEVDANGLPVRVWDLKTGAARLTPKRIEEIRKHLPEGSTQIPIHAVNP